MFFVRCLRGDWRLVREGIGGNVGLRGMTIRSLCSAGVGPYTDDR